MKKTVCFECGCTKMFPDEGAYFDKHWFHCWNCLTSYKNLKAVRENKRWKNRK